MNPQEYKDRGIGRSWNSMLDRDSCLYDSFLSFPGLLICKYQVEQKLPVPHEVLCSAYFLSYNGICELYGNNLVSFYSVYTYTNASY